MKPSEHARIGRIARREILRAIHRARKGHLGGALSCVDAVLYLFMAELVDVHQGTAMSAVRRPFVLSKAHSATALLAVVQVLYPKLASQLSSYNLHGSLLGNNPSERVFGVEYHGGSLGHGIGFGCGLALAKKFGADIEYVTVMTSDGELHEGSCWESILFAAHHRLNICIFIDANGQICEDMIDNVLKLGSIATKLRAFGLEVIEIDGHSFSDLTKINSFLAENSMPRAVVLKTVKGKGVDFMEGAIRFHHGIPTDEELKLSLAQLEDIA